MVGDHMGNQSLRQNSADESAIILLFQGKGVQNQPRITASKQGFRVESVFCHLYFCDHKNTYFFDTFFFIWKVILVVPKSHHTCSALHPACSMLYVITEEQL